MNTVNYLTEKEREHPHCHLIQLLSFISFFIIWVLDSFVLIYSVGLSSLIPLTIRLIVFCIIILFSFALLRSTHDILLRNGHPNNRKGQKHHPPNEVIDYGVMTYIRHPLYLAILLFYFAFVLLTMSIMSFLVWIIIFFIHNRMASFEETQLMLMFKEDYREYKKRVPKWIPNPIKFFRL